MVCANVESGREDDGERFGADQRHAETECRHVEEENGIPFCGKAEPLDGVERHHGVCDLDGGEQREDPHRACARVRQRQREGLRQHAAARGKDGASERTNDPGVLAGKVFAAADKRRGDGIGDSPALVGDLTKVAFRRSSSLSPPGRTPSSSAGLDGARAESRECDARPRPSISRRRLHRRESDGQQMITRCVRKYVMGNRISSLPGTTTATRRSDRHNEDSRMRHTNGPTRMQQSFTAVLFLAALFVGLGPTEAAAQTHTFVSDTAPGKATGQGLNLNGGLWYVLSPSGQVATGLETNA